MENMSMRRYFRNLGRSLDCPKSLRQSFLSQTRRMAEDFVQGKPDATVQEVSDYLGDPRELAQGFLETLDQDILERYQKRKRRFRVGLVAVLAIALVVVTCWAIDLYTTPYRIEVSSITIVEP